MLPAAALLPDHEPRCLQAGQACEAGQVCVAGVAAQREGGVADSERLQPAGKGAGRCHASAAPLVLQGQPLQPGLGRQLSYPGLGHAAEAGSGGGLGAAVARGATRAGGSQCMQDAPARCFNRS